MFKLVISFFVILAVLLLTPGLASASIAKCLGQKAQVISKSNTKIEIPRKQNVLLKGNNVKVYAAGDNRVCSTKGDITLTFGRGRSNKANLGSGNDRVIISSRANSNSISLGPGNDFIKVKNKANSHTIFAGAGDDTIITAAKTNILKLDAGDGDNRIILAAKANRQLVTSGDGNDYIQFKTPARANKRLLKTGLGNDTVYIQAKGHSTVHLSKEANPLSLPDTDTYHGGPSNDTVYDYHGGDDNNPNRIYGNNGFDKLHSYGDAYSHIYGGDGTDYIYSASSGVSGDRLIGNRGNDKLFANRAQANQQAKGAFLDGSEGDDWLYGTSGDDTMIALAGIKKVYGYGGNDTIIKTGNGIGTLEGGPGFDTISYIGHTPPGYGRYSGVMINLNENKGMNGKGIDTIRDIEHLIGSPFDDWLTGKSGVDNIIDGGIGNDLIEADSPDQVDGGLGENECLGGKQVRCNQDSPGAHTPQQLILDIGLEGILTVLGSNSADQIEVGYDRLAAAYIVDTNKTATLSRDCQMTEIAHRYRCPARYDVLTAVTIDGADGNDQIVINYSVPKDVNTIVSGGEGYDTVLGGQSRDFITTSEKVNGRDGGDMLYHAPGAVTNGGAGSDTFHINEVCSGGKVYGGGGRRDGAVFAGSKQGVNANLITGKVKFADKKQPCLKPVKLGKDINGLEGSKYDDILTGHYNKRTTYLGRDGADIFNADNNAKDTVTTGGGGKNNKVYSDKRDKVVFGWGLAAF
jgi:Ca2+-binding RTX toxin-like protein